MARWNLCDELLQEQILTFAVTILLAPKSPLVPSLIIAVIFGETLAGYDIFKFMLIHL